MEKWKKQEAGKKRQLFRKRQDITPKEAYTWKDYGAVFLRTIKLVTNFAYILILLFGLLGAGIGMGYLVSQIDSVTVPPKEELIAQVSQLSKVSQITYSDGQVISKIDSDLLRTPVESSAISQNVKDAIIATEDENFMSHNGVVPKAIFRATLGSVLGIGESSGGSTLTQQLIKQQILGDAPTFKRKATEIVYALELERNLDKDAILTNYLNVSPFGRNNTGQNIAGIEEAAQGIFGVSARDLTIPQAAFLAGLPQSPIVYSPYTSTGAFKSEENMAWGLNRAQAVLYNMYRAGILSKADYDSYAAYDLKQDFKQPEARTVSNHDYLYYSVLSEAQDRMYDYIIQRDGVSAQDLKNDATKEAYRAKAVEELAQGGYTVTSTIHPTVHQAMQDTVTNYGRLLDDGTGQVEVGNVLMDNKTGAILGFIGGRNYATNQNNHAFSSKRSTGSSIKPILPYAIAIDQGLMGSASVLSNYPTTFSNGSPIYHDGDLGTTMISLEESLNVSWNIPAFWTYKLLRDKGVDVQSYMEKMGYDIPEYGIESLSLGGGVEVSVLQQTNAYQTIANGGQYQESYIVESITDSQGKVIYQHEQKPVKVFSPATASIMAMMLRGPVRSGITTSFISQLGGINASLVNADWIGKTGTSNDFRDSWLMVATPRVTLGTWAGHDDNRSLARLTGYNNVARFVATLTSTIHQADPSLFGSGERFALDSSVIASNVLKSTGLPPGSVEVNGKTVSVSGETTTSYWAKNGAPRMNYYFAIGGTQSDYVKAWSALSGNSDKEQDEETDEEDTSTTESEAEDGAQTTSDAKTEKTE
ncbi:penicillin-binding protein PBP1B [Streptococcus plurextorum]|uniref:penicillin-binding protein PBP1B n=1 Tax=Streptococcus plurextorum TaxID=456876 RepID=UPI0004060A48|nr:penicillin-binding protein PBP1B [Streptococcus plurextorum]